MAGMDQKGRCSGVYKAGIAGYYAPRAVFLSLVGRSPECSAFGPVRNLKDSCPRDVQSWFFLVFLHLTLCCLRCTGKLDFGRWRLFFFGPLYLGSHLFELLP